MVTRVRVAAHRKHHARTEEPEDPHSPQIHGIKKVLLEGAELYREAAAVQSDLDKYGKGTPNDWLEKNLYSRFVFVGVGSLALIEFCLLGLAGIAIFAVQMFCIPAPVAGVWQAAGARQEALKLALQEWCQQADETGVECLQVFAGRLRGYRLQPVS